jgi:dephospho-CoA kinase
VIKRIGLTGSIASGKSTASAEFKKLGAFVVDYDEIAKDLLNPKSSLYDSTMVQELVKSFGKEILNKGFMEGADSAVDRGVLSSIVYKDQKKRLKLNRITHPHIIDVAFDIERSYSKDNQLVVHDVPLLVETNMTNMFDDIIVVKATKEKRYKRLIEDRKMSPDLAKTIIETQLSDEEQAKCADIIFNGADDVDVLRKEVRAYYKKELEKIRVQKR